MKWNFTCLLLCLAAALEPATGAAQSQTAILDTLAAAVRQREHERRARRQTRVGDFGLTGQQQEPGLVVRGICGVRYEHLEPCGRCGLDGAQNADIGPTVGGDGLRGAGRVPVGLGADLVQAAEQAAALFQSNRMGTNDGQPVNLDQ